MFTERRNEINVEENPLRHMSSCYGVVCAAKESKNFPAVGAVVGGRQKEDLQGNVFKLYNATFASRFPSLTYM